MRSLILLLPALALGAEVTPTGKVIQLLDDLLTKAQVEKNNEAKMFKSFMTECADFQIERETSIKELTENIDKCEAQKNKDEADRNLLNEEIKEHEGDITAYTGDRNAATRVRSMENIDYKKTRDEYTEALRAVKGAIKTLRAVVKDTPQSFVQLKASLLPVVAAVMIPVESKSQVTSFLQQIPDAPKANAYTSSVQKIVTMLEDLDAQFTDEKNQSDLDEKAALDAYDNLMSDMEKRIADSTARKEDKTKTVGELTENIGRLGVELTADKESRATNQEGLDKREATCASTGRRFEMRQKLRAEEIEAITKAREIISSDDVQGNAAEAMTRLVQKQSLLQFGSETQSAFAVNRALAFLKGSKSPVITALVVAAQGGKFDKVIGMVNKLIERLVQETKNEATAKSQCDKDLVDNEKIRNTKTQDVNDKSAKFEQNSAEIAAMQANMNELMSDNAAMAEESAKATKERKEEKEANKKTIADSTLAITAVKKAIGILEEFYSKASKASALVQEEPAEYKKPGEAESDVKGRDFEVDDHEPEVFSASFQGVAGNQGGIVGLLQTIVSDFEVLKSNTESQEDTAQREYEALIEGNDKATKVNQRNFENIRLQKQTLANENGLLRDDLTADTESLSSALDEFAALKKQCLDRNFDYAERVAKREKEIEDLKRALEILGGQ